MPPAKRLNVHRRRRLLISGEIHQAYLNIERAWLRLAPEINNRRKDCPWGEGAPSFLTDVLALAGEDPDAVREGVRVALADCEAIFRVREDNKRMKDQAARVCRALCRTRVVAEMHQRRGTRLADL